MNKFDQRFVVCLITDLSVVLGTTEAFGDDSLQSRVICQLVFYAHWLKVLFSRHLPLVILNLDVTI